jgi:uncharacterized protein
MKKNASILFSILTIALFTLGISSCSGLSGGDSAATPVGTNQNTGLWVTGVGTVTVTPDTAVLALGVQAQALTVSDAQQQAATAMSNVMAALKSQGVADKDIATSLYNITPIYSYDSQTGVQHLDGYSVVNTVTVKVRNVGNTGAVIDAVAAAGGNYTRISSVTLTVDQPDQYNSQARDLAMADALNRAKQLAKLGGLRLGKPTYINESLTAPPQIIDYPAAGKSVPVPTTPISPGQMEITLTVQVVYSMS